MITDPLTEKVLAAIFEVSNTIGAGFLEKVYQHALLQELKLRGIQAIAEAPFTVRYKGILVGQYYADILVEDALLVELKCVESLRNEHLATCLNYLKASGLPTCLLVNFQRPKVEWKRVFSITRTASEETRLPPQSQSQYAASRAATPSVPSPIRTS